LYPIYLFYPQISIVSFMILLIVVSATIFYAVYDIGKLILASDISN